MREMRRAVAIAVIATTLQVACTVAETPEALLVSAKNYLSKNDTKAAVIQLKNALQKNPELAEARFLLGTTLLSTGDVMSAEKELRKARELKYPDEQVVPSLASAMVLRGDYKEVTDEFSTVQITTPRGRAELLTAVGLAHLGLGNADAARTAFATAVAAEPKYIRAHLGQAQLLVGTGNLGQALETVDRALAIAPADHDLWRVKGDIFAAQGQQDQALAAYRKSVDVKPDSVAGHAAVVSILIQQKKLDDAAKQLNMMKSLVPGHPTTLYLQALLAYAQKNFAAARDAIQQQLRVAPDNMPGALLAAAIELELKSYAQAETHASKVLQRVPKEKTARRILVTSYLRQGKAEKAMDTLKPALDDIDKDSTMLALAGEVYMMNGQPAQAADFFTKATALDPSNTRKRTAVALSHMATGETDRAFGELERTATIDSGVGADLAAIAFHMHRREYEKALAAIDTVEKKQPTGPLAHNLRGMALLGKNDTAGARRSFERALEADPTYFQAAASLAVLDLVDKKPDAARKRYEAVLAKDPNHLQALLALAVLNSRTGGTSDQVVALIKRAVTAHPVEPAPRLTLIQYYIGKKDNKKAVAAGQEALAAIPDNTEILDAAGRAHEAAGETNQALSIYGKLASIQPGSPYPYLRMAEMQIATKKKDDAFESLRKALIIKADSVEAQRGLIILYLDTDRRREAIAVARDVQKQRPKQAIGYVLEGDIHAAQKNWGEAATTYRAGLQRAPSTELASRLHSALSVGGSATSAEQFAASWLKDNPKDGAFRMYVADSATSAKDYRTAAQHYRKLLEANPNDAVVLNNLAFAAGQLKEPDALTYAEKANELVPNQPNFMDTLGALLIQSGDAPRGVQLLQKASVLAPKSAVIRLNLAKGLIKVGQKDAASKELDELAKLGDKFPGHAEVAQLKRAL